MPKHEIHHSAGTRVPSKVREMLQSFFQQNEIEKLERLGGRVLVSVASPYKKKGRNQAPQIDSQFLDKLNAVKHCEDTLREVISELSSKELRQVGKLINCPLKTSANRQELIEGLIRYLNDEAIWRGIVDTKK